MKVSVLGAGGYLGARLIETSLLARGLPWTAVLRGARGLARLSRFGGLDFRLTDSADAGALGESLKGAEVLVYAVLGDTHKMVSDLRTAVEAAKRAGVRRFIFLSSAVILGGRAVGEPSGGPVDAKGHWMYYAREKAKCELVLERLGESIEVVVLRPGLIWGPGSPWSHLPARQLSQGRVWLASRGERLCNLIYLDNLVAIIRSVATYDGGLSGTFNVADPDLVSWKRYYERVANALEYDSDRLREYSGGRLPWSAAIPFELLKQQSWFYSLSKEILNRLSGESKAKLKGALPWLAGGKVAPPLPMDCAPGGEPVRFSYEMWALQNAGPPEGLADLGGKTGSIPLLGFEECMRRTGNWLRFAGYGRRPHEL